MNYFVFPLFLCCFRFIPVTGWSSIKTESELIKQYWKYFDQSSYDKRVAPEGTSGVGSPVDVSVSMHILDISKVDEHEMHFDVHLFLRQSWVDRRLQFTNKISEIFLNDVNKFWTPDLYFINEKEGSLQKIIQPNAFFRIQSNGTVHYSVRLFERLRCLMDFRQYPLDTHNCVIEVESYCFTRQHIQLMWATKGKNEPPIDVSWSNITEADFDFTCFRTDTKHTVESTGNYTALEVTFTLKRKAGYFASKLYTPLIFLVSASWLSFWMTAKDRCLRLVLLFVIMYLMVTTSIEFNNKILVPYIKASDVWIRFCEVLVFAALLEFIAVCLLIGRESSEGGFSGKREIDLNSDPESKYQNLNTECLKSPLRRVRRIFEAGRGGNGRNKKLSHSVDRISRIIFPAIFVLFNIVYWTVYSS